MSTDDVTTPAPEGGDAPESAGGGIEDALREAGLDPGSTDWAEVAAKTQYVDSLTDPDRHLEVLEASLREWGHLPEGRALAELLGQQQAPAESEQPQWPGYGPRPGDGEMEVLGFTRDGEPIFSQPPGGMAEPDFSPQDFEQHMLNQIPQQVNQQVEARMQEFYARQVAVDLDRQLGEVRDTQGLSEDEAAFLWNAVTAHVAQGQADITGPQSVQGLVAQVQSDIESITNARMARMLDGQKNRPQTTYTPGAAPADQQRPSNLAEVRARTAERLGIDLSQEG